MVLAGDTVVCRLHGEPLVGRRRRRPGGGAGRTPADAVIRRREPRAGEDLADADLPPRVRGLRRRPHPGGGRRTLR